MGYTDLSQMTEKEFDYLLNFEIKMFKVHESKHINEKCKSTNSGYDHISNIKVRPIVASPLCTVVK